MNVQYNGEKYYFPSSVKISGIAETLLSKGLVELFEDGVFKWNLAFFLNNQIISLEQLDNYLFENNDNLLILIQLSGG